MSTLTRIIIRALSKKRKGFLNLYYRDIIFILDTRRGGERSHYQGANCFPFFYFFARGCGRGVRGVACVRGGRGVR